MFGFLLTILIIDSIVLGTVVLLQSGKGGGLAAMGGGASTDTFLGGRQAVTILTKMSWWCGALFLLLSLTLAGLSAGGGTARSVLEGQVGPPAPITAPTLPLELDAPPGDGAAPAPTQPAPTEPQGGN